MARDKAAVPDGRSVEDEGEVSHGPVVDPDANQKAAALVSQREETTPEARWEQLLGRTLGDKIYGALTREITPARILQLGQQALDREIGQLVARLRAQMPAADPLERMRDDQIAQALQAQLSALARTFMTTGEGARLAATLAKIVDADPVLILSAALLAAVVAIAADMKIPELTQRFGLGGGLSVRLGTELGSLRHVAVQSLSAALEYQGQAITARVGYERQLGDKAQQTLRPYLVSGHIPDGAVDRLTADVVFRLQALDGAQVHLTDETVMQHGRVLGGTIGAHLDGRVADGLSVGLGAQERYGANAGGDASLTATYRPDPQHAFSLSLTQGIGRTSSTGVAFTMQLRDRVQLQGHYDHKDGAWVGVVIHLP